MAAPGEKSFRVLNITRVSLWLLCNVHFVRRRKGPAYGQDRVLVPPPSRDLADLKARFIAAVKNSDAPLLTRVWQELEYCIDVYRVTPGAHIEHL